jgi:rSAM/selenodomain-associated transferase 1
MRAADAVVMVFVKMPDSGNVKTRLAIDVGPELAVRAHECMVLDVFDAATATDAEMRVFVDPPDALARAREWLGNEPTVIPQSGSDLGERMERAFLVAFSEGFSRAVLVGCDIPGLNAKILNAALSALETNHAVIGPANDGGYYLIGFRKDTFAPKVFRDMRWSENSVLDDTLRRLKSARRTVAQLEKLIDIDMLEDVRLLKARPEYERTISVRTREVFDLMSVEAHGDDSVKQHAE